MLSHSPSGEEKSLRELVSETVTKHKENSPRTWEWVSGGGVSWEGEVRPRKKFYLRET